MDHMHAEIWILLERNFGNDDSVVRFEFHGEALSLIYSMRTIFFKFHVRMASHPSGLCRGIPN